MGQYLAARHANPGIRLRASALHRCPRGCDKLGHFPGGPDRPGRSEAAFAVSEDVGKSHGAGGRARLGQQVKSLEVSPKRRSCRPPADRSCRMPSFGPCSRSPGRARAGGGTPGPATPPGAASGRAQGNRPRSTRSNTRPALLSHAWFPALFQV